MSTIQTKCRKKKLLRKGKKEKDKEWKRSKEKGGNERQKETEKNKDGVLVKREKGLMQVLFLTIGKKNGQ